MSGRYLLDTNVAIRVLNREIDLSARRQEGLEVFLSITVVGELLYGAEKSTRPESNRESVERLFKSCPVVTHDIETARRYGALKANLKKRGRPIPENDIWIAVAALQHGLVLVTGDRHFEEIGSLQIEAW